MVTYNWFKLHHGITSNSKWPLIARKTGTSVGVVVSVWVAILEHASQQEDRGDVLNFSCEEFDCCYGYEDGTCQKIFDALSDRGLISEGYVTHWEERQSLPERESQAMSSTERSRKHREKMKQEAEALQRNATDATKCNDGNVARNDATHREDKIREDKNKIRSEEIREEENTPLPPKGDEPAQEVQPPTSEVQSEAQPEPVQTEVKDDTLPPKKYRRDDFITWYEAYPNQVKKKLAARDWASAVKKNVLPDINFLLADIERQKAGNPKWREGFIPDPTTYLSGRRWNDKWPAPQPQSSPMNGYPRFQQTGKLQGEALHEHNMEVARIVLAQRAQARAEGKPASPLAALTN